MGKVQEFNKVYVEYPDNFVDENDSKFVDKVTEIEEIHADEVKSDKVIVESRTTKLSKEELRRKLEETQALHL